MPISASVYYCKLHLTKSCHFVRTIALKRDNGNIINLDHQILQFRFFVFQALLNYHAMNSGVASLKIKSRYASFKVLSRIISLGIALMRVFPKAIVLTTKPRIDTYVLFTSKRDLMVRTIAVGKTHISAINCFQSMNTKIFA